MKNGGRNARLCFFSSADDLFKHAHEVAGADLSGNPCAEFPAYKFLYAGGARAVLGTALRRHTVEIAAYCRTFLATDLYYVADMGERAMYGVLAAEEVEAEINTHRPAAVGNGAYLTVGEIAADGMQRISV